MHPSTPAKTKTARRQRGPARKRNKGESK
jgi:hypothetical protein